MKSFHDNGRHLVANDLGVRSLPPQERMGAELKTLFEALTAGPMPDRLLQLADALEEAFQKGDLFEPRNLDS